MSAELMGAVLYLDLPDRRKLILVAMADNANEAGRCWPSQALIALKASISVRRLRDHLKGLEVDGWLTVLDSGQGRGQTGQYLLNADAIHQQATARRLSLRKGEKGDVVAYTPDAIGDAPTTKGDGVAEKGDASVLQNPQEPSREPSPFSKETTEAIQELVTAVGGDYAVVHAPKELPEDWEEELEEMRSAEMQIEALLEENPKALPPWVRKFTIDPRFSDQEPSQEWIDEIEVEYKGQNLYLAATNCYNWLITSPKGKKRKTWEGTFETWLKKNKAEQPSRREEPDGDTMEEGAGNRYTRQKAKLG